MELIQLKYFLAVAREESISRAADYLFITQPSLTRQIQNMEKEVGSPLFMRGGKKMRLTEVGLLLKKRAEEMLALYEKTERELIHPNRQVSGDVFLGGAETHAMKLLLSVAGELQRCHPDIRIHLYSGDIADVCDRLDKGLLDFGLVIEPADLSKYESLRLPAMERWGLFVNRDHPLAKQSEITPKDLVDLPIVQSRHSLPTSTLCDWYRPVADRIRLVGTYNLINNAAYLAEENIACVLGIDKLLNLTGESRLKFLPLSPAVEAHLDVVWKKYQVFSPAAQLFLHLLEETLSPERQVY